MPGRPHRGCTWQLPTRAVWCPDGAMACRGVFASEPDVQNPIAMAWDGRGRLWIADRENVFIYPLPRRRNYFLSIWRMDQRLCYYGLLCLRAIMLRCGREGRPVTINTRSSVFLLMGALFAGLAVAAGAFGAHFLKGFLGIGDQINMAYRFPF